MSAATCPRCHGTGGEWGGGFCSACKGAGSAPPTRPTDIDRLRAETARVCELAERLERVTLPHQARYACVVLAHHQLERALRFLSSPDADDENAAIPWRPTGTPRGDKKLLHSEADRPMDDDKSGPLAGCSRRAALEER